MALAYSTGMAAGTVAPDFRLKAVDGREYSLASFAAAKVLVVVFTCNHCPYAKAVEPRLIALQHEFRPRGVEFVLINPNDATRYPDDSFEAMVVRAEEQRFPFVYLHDETQAVARAYDAACTPDIFVFDHERRLICQTRCDDNWQDATKVTRHELREVLLAALEGHDAGFTPQPSMGCSIKWKA